MSAPTDKTHLGGVVYLAFLGLVLAGSGIVFMYLLWQSYQRAQSMDGYPQVEAVIISSEMAERQATANVKTEYRLNILFGYTYEGKNYTNDSIQLRPNPWLKKKEKVEALVAEFPVGKTVPAWVRPADPEVAVLKPETKAPGYSIWFPGVFVLGGLGMVAGAIRAGFRSRGKVA